MEGTTMGDSLYLASSGAAARLQQLEIVANNLANSDTVGFRADRALFETALDAVLLDADGKPIAGAAPLSYVETSRVLTSQARGPIRRTGSPLDVAIEGGGFFQVESSVGPRFTRAGAFTIDPSGTLVTMAGEPVLGSGGAITVGIGPSHIEADGRVVDSEGLSLGELTIYEFENPAVLTKEGRGLFRAPEGVTPSEVEQTSLIPGSLEQSNVQPVHELATLVILQRAFDASMQTLNASDDLSRRLIQEISR